MMGTYAADQLCDAVIDEANFKRVMGSFPTGVTIVTSRDPQGDPIGLTANAVSSVSKDPPLLLVCIGAEKFTLRAIEQSGAFSVNFLGTTQESLARRFASPGADKFADLEIRSGALGMPLLEGSLAYAECALYRTVSAGDHSVVLGRVIGGAACTSTPLLYFRGRFFSGESLHV